jgi:hypothetical protein
MSMEASPDSGKPIADPEKQVALEQNAARHTADVEEKDPNIIGWEHEDPENPLNWTSKKKWSNGGLIAGMTFVTYG